LEAFREYVESGAEGGEVVAQHPRWVRVNTLKTTLEQQLESTFKDFTQTKDINDVLRRGTKKVYIDEHIPNLVALPPGTDLSRTPAYNSGALIIQDKASCFPAYLLNPAPEDGDIIDSCAAPGNKTTHIACVIGPQPSSENGGRKIFAFEKDPGRAKILEKMVSKAGSDGFTKINAGMDFLKASPNSDEFRNVGALLLDPSCSGSGIVGRDEMPPLILPDPDATIGGPAKPSRNKKKKKPEAASSTPSADPPKGILKRKRGDDLAAGSADDKTEVLIDDDGEVTAVTSGADLATRLEKLAAFQLQLLLHALSFPAARKITYSTCSVHAEENEAVALAALRHKNVRARGWRVLKRGEQVGGLRKWDVRGDEKWCYENCGGDGEAEELAEACIRASKEDGRGTMGFFVVGFVRDAEAGAADGAGRGDDVQEDVEMDNADAEDAEEWGGIDEPVGVEDEPGAVEDVPVVKAPVVAKEAGNGSEPTKKKRRKQKKKSA
jgi:putative methyltransferase